jgi:hypothetical protein
MTLDKTVQVVCIGAMVLIVGMVIWVAEAFVNGQKYPSYKEICSPNHFLVQVPYYNGRSFAACGSPSSEPVLVEIKPIK